jgi:hypothetical protein
MVMKESVLQGQPYQYYVVALKGKRQFQLYKNGVFKYSLDQSELDDKIYYEPPIRQIL